VSPVKESAKTEEINYAPKKLTPAENAALTIKLLAVVAVLGALLWAFYTFIQ
jgi:hypothetical protein